MYAVQRNTSANIYQTTATSYVSKAKKMPQKPIWNPNKVFHYLEDMNRGFLSYGEEAVSYYRGVISEKDGNRTLSIEELKAQITEYFPEYTMTDREPAEVTDGKFYLYIDEKNLRKMASDPEYRAKVYGLMDRELQGKNGYTLQYSDGRNVTSHLTGTIFSLAETNKKYAGADGIPYRGSAKSDHCFSTSSSHPKVRNMGFLYDHIDPVKSAAKDRKTNAAKLTAKRLEKMRKKKLEERKSLEEKNREHTAKASVGFPEGKRAAQIDAAMSSSDIQSVILLLEKDLSECEKGAEEGLCDETEVQKVEAMMERAAKKQRQIEAQESKNPDKKVSSGVNILI